ncbi:unnamed protein product [Candida verbasci]|uniref:L-type lectin-like domain-containing protein n=1 Tax=Candida verbasci TaxID=1227364 RepID=A0A9W4TSM3_9ASCO|nr:unnamed protein product [Candida verbasci]
MKFLILLLQLISITLAIVPNVNHIPENKKEQNPLKFESTEKSLSLPNLLTIDSKSQISNYDLSKTINYDNGRLLLDKNGVMWSKNTLPQDEFTIEVDFRSTGRIEDLQFLENQLSIILAENIQSFDKFDGFKFLINNQEQEGLKIFNNDGSKTLNNLIDESIGDCKFRYLESNVPFTIRISYKRSESWFKVQIDNNLCFKTNRIQIPNNSKLRLGVFSIINRSSIEEFEILNVKVWDHLIEDAIDDHGLMNDGEVKVEFKTIVVEESQATDAIKPEYKRESLMEKAQKQRQESMQVQDFNVLKKLQDLEYQQNEKIDKLIQIQNELNSNLQNQKKELQQLFTTQYAEILSSISTLNQKLIGEVREQHFGMEELSKKVDLLMNNHKEIAYQYEKNQIQQQQQQQQHIQVPTSSVFDSLIKWILVPLLIILIILVIFVYRLRHDIKHSKLL